MAAKLEGDVGETLRAAPPTMPLWSANVSTTANVYVQGSSADLEDKLRKVWDD